MQPIQVALLHHQNGALDLAEAAYRKCLAANPNDVDANHYLGMLLHRLGRGEEGLEYVERSIASQGQNWVFLNNLATIYIDLRKLDLALDTLARARALNKKSFEVLNNIGKALSLLGRIDEAIDSYRRSLVASPANAATLSALSKVYLAVQRWNDAENFARKAILHNPNLSEGHMNLGIALSGKGDIEPALRELELSIALAPKEAAPREAMGSCLLKSSRLSEAETYLKSALEIEPTSTGPLHPLAECKMLLGQYSGALEILKRLEATAPESTDVLTDIATCLGRMGRPDEAIEYYRRAQALPNVSSLALSNYLFTLLHSDSATSEDIWCEHKRVGQIFEQHKLPNLKAHRNELNPKRKLRVGFVSADLRSHPVAFFIEPILQHLDRSSFELFAYHNYPSEDAVSTRLKALFDHWLPCFHVNEEQLVVRIQEDEIDVLFDLSGHTAYNRLVVFAQKPAPVQITWIGYPGTTGLRAMDYKITDALMDPVGLADLHHSETLIRLPGRGAAFAPPANAPAVGEPPSSRNGHLTFGCLNNPAKIGKKAAKTWSSILSKFPDSRLILSTHEDPAIINHLTSLFSTFGIGADRLVLEPWRDFNQYLQLHNEIDIALDPFPYNGGTSTLYAVYMGVPVITLAGDHTVSRVGITILAPLGLEVFVAHSESEYIERAVGLASDLAALKLWRTTLRDKLMLDPQANSASITRELENAIRSAWIKWCTTPAVAQSA